MAKREPRLCVECGDPAPKGLMHCEMHYREALSFVVDAPALATPVKKRINVKKKGNRYELHIAKILQDWFPNRAIKRSSILQCTTSHATADIIGCGPWHPECKDTQSLSMFDWCRKLIEVCSQTGEYPVVFFHQPASKGYKGRDCDWMVCKVDDFPMLAQDFMENQ